MWLVQYSLDRKSKIFNFEFKALGFHSFQTGRRRGLGVSLSQTFLVLCLLHRRGQWERKLGCDSFLSIAHLSPNQGVLALLASPQVADVLDDTFHHFSCLSCHYFYYVLFELWRPAVHTVPVLWENQSFFLAEKHCFISLSITFLMIPNFYIVAAAIWWAMSFWLPLRLFQVPFP